MMRRLFLPPLTLVLAACATIPASKAPPAHASAAWVTFDAERMTGAGADGLADRAADRALTVEDPVRVASVSKIVVALGVMRLVEEGKLELDADVSTWLGWQLRNPAFPDRPITLRLLLSHQSSLTDAADYVIPLGDTVERWVAQPQAFDSEHPPGTFFRYSNLNFPVVGTVIERVTGERFDRAIRRLVIEPLGLDACFNWSGCSDRAIHRAVVLYAPSGEVVRDDLKGAPPPCHVVPAKDGSCELPAYQPGSHGGLFSPQGGLRISMADLAKVGQLLLRKGQLADGRRFLAEASIAEILRPAWRFDGSNGETDRGFYCAYGLSTQTTGACAPGDDPFGDGRPRVGHAGDAYGVRSGLWIDPERGTGIVYFAAGLGDEPPRGRSAYRAVEEWLAAKAR